MKIEPRTPLVVEIWIDVCGKNGWQWQNIDRLDPRSEQAAELISRTGLSFHDATNQISEWLDRNEDIL